jgi:hypothetical protein
MDELTTHPAPSVLSSVILAAVGDVVERNGCAADDAFEELALQAALQRLSMRSLASAMVSEHHAAP